MFSWIFKNKVPSVIVASKEEDVAKSDFIKPHTANALLNTPRRQKLLMNIWQRTSVSRSQFEQLYQKPIERYAELVQQFPASESHHHAYAGGMLDHGLEIMAYALKLRQSHLLPIGSTPEEQSAQSEAWSAAVAYAALLHDIGKIAVDLHVEYENEHIWHPWQGVILKPYRFKYRKDREYRLHSACSGLLCNQILEPPIMDWLSQIPVLWSSLLYTLAGQVEYAGVLGEIVTKADKASVSQELGGDPVKAMSAPKNALQRKLLDGLRYLIKEELKLNNAGPSDGWLTEDALWLVSKTVSDKLRAHLLSQGVSGIPSKNSAIFDVMQEHNLLLPTPEQKAIWNAAVSSDSGWSNKFTFLKMNPTLIWDTEQQPEAFEGTVIVSSEKEKIGSEATLTDQQTSKALISSNVSTSVLDKRADSLDSVFDLLGLGDMPNTLINNEKDHHEEVADSVTKPPVEVLHAVNVEPKLKTKTEPVISIAKASQSPQPLLPAQWVPQPMIEPVTDSTTPSGEHFLQWLKEAILNKKLIINDARALVHTVADTIYIVTPGIFIRYAQEFPIMQKLAEEEDLKEFRWVQIRFEKLKIHKRQFNGLNIWTCTVKGPRKTRKVHGYLLLNPEAILSDISYNNPYLELVEENV